MTVLFHLTLAIVLWVPKASSLPSNFPDADDFKEELLEVHNDHRKAGSMKEIKWDDKLDEKAKVTILFRFPFS